jgi:hypothetical protein
MGWWRNAKRIEYGIIMAEQAMGRQLKGIAYAKKSARLVRRLRTKISIENQHHARCSSLAQRPRVIVLYDRNNELSLHNH